MAEDPILISVMNDDQGPSTSSVLGGRPAWRKTVNSDDNCESVQDVQDGSNSGVSTQVGVRLVLCKTTKT